MPHMLRDASISADSVRQYKAIQLDITSSGLVIAQRLEFLSK
jgi:hypothetical protein